VNSALSPQLQNLHNAIEIGNPDQPCAKYQFLGEYLHAFADTFSHRDGMNRPIDALTLGLGVGHGFSGEQPDYTYNGDPAYTGNDPYIKARAWNVREDRTLAAEKGIYAQLKSYSGGKSVSTDVLESTLKSFNAIREHGENSPQKKQLLQDQLNQWINDGTLKLADKDGKKVEKIEMIADPNKPGSSAKDAYDSDVAAKYREQFLGSLKGQENKYPGVCLPESPVCKEVKF
jgi:hypothetical protein